MEQRTRRHFGRIVAALKQARRTRDELAGRALMAGAPAYGRIGSDPASMYTRAKLFQGRGKRTPVFVRFSTVIHGGHSPENLRDPRGFAVKFYTEDCNWDPIGNNLQIIFIRDDIKFTDLVHAFKPDPVTNRQDARRNSVDFSDDKLLQGRTFSYSDTQRHRAGSNYLQLPINRPKTHVAINQRDGQMAYHVDGVEAGENPHVNYEPSSKTESLREAPRTGKGHTPYVSGYVVRQKISRLNNYGQADARYRAMEDWERDELISNLVSLVGQCDEEYGRRLAEGLCIKVGEDPTVETAGAL